MRHAFLLGHYKSGSTWLLQILSLYPGVRGVNETHVFRHALFEEDPAERTRKILCETPWGRANQFPGGLGQEERPMNVCDLSTGERAGLEERLSGLAPAQEYCRAFFDLLAKSLSPQECLLEKTPRNTRFVPFIRSVFPKARLLAIQRDGRDAVISDRFFRQSQPDIQERSFEESVLAWRSDMEDQRKAMETDELCVVSYEALLADGPTVVERVLRFLDVPVDREMVADVVQRTSFEFLTGRKPGCEVRGRFLRKGAVGDWRNHFGPQEKRLFKELAGDMLVDLGYEESHDW